MWLIIKSYKNTTFIWGGLLLISSKIMTFYLIVQQLLVCFVPCEVKNQCMTTNIKNYNFRNKVLPFLLFCHCLYLMMCVSFFNVCVQFPLLLIFSSVFFAFFQWDLCPRRPALGHLPGDHLPLHHPRPHQDRHEAAGVLHAAVRYQQAGPLHVGPRPLPAPENPRYQRR